MPSVLITGTSKGIGLESALAFARAGYSVHATMRNPDGAPGLAKTAAREKLPIHVSAMDVDSDASVRSSIAAILEAHGTIDVLVNNAGIETSGSIEEIPFAEFRATMETNYFGSVRTIQALAPHMRQRRSGRIINVTSVAGRVAFPGVAPYSASKWALEALSEALAAELKTFGVRVALIEPGVIDTSMARRIEAPGQPSHYHYRARLTKMFVETLKNPVPPSVVARKILEVAQSDGWQLRHLAGPDAPGFIDWRKSMTDEEWVSLNASDDDAYFRSVANAFGGSAQA